MKVAYNTSVFDHSNQSMKHKVFVRFPNYIQCLLRTKKIKSYVQGRTAEVASLIDKLIELDINFPPCVTHSLDKVNAKS